MIRKIIEAIVMVPPGAASSFRRRIARPAYRSSGRLARVFTDCIQPSQPSPPLRHFEMAHDAPIPILGWLVRRAFLPGVTGSRARHPMLKL